MARKKPRKKTSIRAKRRTATLKVQDQFVRREHTHRIGQAERALMSQASNADAPAVVPAAFKPVTNARDPTPLQLVVDVARD